MDTIFEIKNHGLENFLLYWVQEEQKVDLAFAVYSENISEKY